MFFDYTTAEHVMDFCENMGIQFQSTFFNDWVEIQVDKKDKEFIAHFPEKMVYKKITKRNKKHS